MEFRKQKTNAGNERVTMYHYENLGQIFHDFRTKQNIALKQVADAHVSAATLSRFEQGKADISITKFLRALDNMHVEVNEFMDAARGHSQTETIEFMSQLVPLEYKRDIKGFQRLFDEQKKKYSENPSVYQYHLKMILAQGFICKCDASIPFPQEYMDAVSDYLFQAEEWSYFELILIGNLYLFMDIDLLHRMGREIAERCYGKRASKSLVRITLLNIFETCIHRDALAAAAYYKEAILPMLENETLLYERNIYHFLVGLFHFKNGEPDKGMEEMEQSIQIYNWLKCENLAENYQKDLTTHTA